MDRYNEAMKVAREFSSLEHLGSKTAQSSSNMEQANNFNKNLETALDGINQKLVSDFYNLKKMNLIAIFAISFSLLFLLICLLLVLFKLATIAMVSAVFSVVANVMTILVFQRQDKIRQTVNSQMRYFSPLYSMSVLFQFCQGIIDSSARDKAIAKLIADFSKLSK
ncbi:MAG: hypothetical protein MUP17_11275 [candidate division Zixibacteria bacterium]|nr:hypothetical protein [candidate division Zixibacteria bacterium]